MGLWRHTFTSPELREKNSVRKSPLLSEVSQKPQESSAPSAWGLPTALQYSHGLGEAEIIPFPSKLVSTAGLLTFCAIK